MNQPQENAPEDWRKGGYRHAYEPIPQPPRNLSTLAKEIIHSSQGPQNVLRIDGLLPIATAIPITIFLGGRLPTDVALSFAGKQGRAPVLGHPIFQTELHDARDLKVNTVWLE